MPCWYGSWQVEGRREWRKLNPWEGTPPRKGEKQGDAAFERSRADAKRMLAEIRGGRDEALVEIRQKVSRQIDRCAHDANGMRDLLALLGNLTAKAAQALPLEEDATEADTGPDGPGSLPGLFDPCEA